MKQGYSRELVQRCRAAMGACKMNSFNPLYRRAFADGVAAAAEFINDTGIKIRLECTAKEMRRASLV